MAMNNLMFWNIVRNLSLICHQKLDSAGKYNSNFQFVDEYVVLPVHFCYSLDSFMNTVGMEPITTVFLGKEHILIYQDESIFHTNEYRNWVWTKKGQQPLRKKDNGRAIHVSDFITEQGWLVLMGEEGKINSVLPLHSRIKSNAQCRQDNGSQYKLPMESSLETQHMPWEWHHIQHSFQYAKHVKDTIEVKTWKFQSALNHVVNPS